MGNVNSRNGRLYLDFRYQGERCREQTQLKDTPANRKRLETLLKRIGAEITLGQFEFAQHFPRSTKVARFTAIEKRQSMQKTMGTKIVNFKDFAQLWLSEKEIEWRTSQKQTAAGVLNYHLIPHFGDKAIDEITKAEILSFRSDLAKVPGRKGQKLSASRINHIMTPLRMILNEAADRFEFTSPWRNIKALKVPRSQIQPFTLEEIELFLNAVSPKLQPYYTLRFFTGLRTGEIDGLYWDQVDLNRREILVTQSLVRGELIATKTDGSYRCIQLNERAYEALVAQEANRHADSPYVFCTGAGSPLDLNNLRNKVWYPTLAFLRMAKRTPYQTRHTYATLLLGAGENPEWIANQLGHSSTTMLFKVYSRFVPNLTRQDGSAFEKILKLAQLKGESSDD